MRIIFIDDDAKENTGDTLPPHLVLIKIREILNLNQANRVRHAGTA